MTTNETKQDSTPAPKTRVRKVTDKAVRRKLGWQITTFCEARFDVLRAKLSPENQTRWDNFSYGRKCSVVMDFVKKGYLI